jgi:hypothetical protein
MNRFAVFALIFLAAGAAAAAAAGRHSASPSASRCGGAFWRLKTLSDAQRRTVELTPQQTTIGAIRERRGPGHPPRRRSTEFQRHVWEVPAQVTAYRREPTGAIRLVLYDDNAYLNAVIPAPDCLPASTRDRDAIAAAWHLFQAKCAKPAPNWQSLGAIFFVRGIGFWSDERPIRGAAPNGAELHPVTGLRIVVGC